MWIGPEISPKPSWKSSALEGYSLAKTGVSRRFSGAKSHHAGEFGVEKFSTDIDSKRVKNNLQGFERNFLLLAGGGHRPEGYKPGTSLTDWAGKGGIPFFMFPLCARGGKSFAIPACKATESDEVKTAALLITDSPFVIPTSYI
jgi:hypothetical protein